MAEAFSHRLSASQSKSVALLFTQAQEAKQKAEAYFQGVVDGIPVPEGVDFSFRLSEDASSVMCIPQDKPKDEPKADA